jgi:hypothetical protein
LAQFYVREDGNSAIISGKKDDKNASFQERHEINLKTWEFQEIKDEFKPVEDYDEFKPDQDQNEKWRYLTRLSPDKKYAVCGHCPNGTGNLRVRKISIHKLEA